MPRARRVTVDAPGSPEWDLRVYAGRRAAARARRIVSGVAGGAKRQSVHRAA